MPGLDVQTPMQAAVPPPGTTTAARSESITALVRELRDASLSLVRQELLLARTELSEKAACVGRNTGYLAIGGTVAYLGVTFVLLGLAAGMFSIFVAAGMDWGVAIWLAPLAIGLVCGVIGAVLVTKALATFRKESLVPQKTITSLQETKEWAQRKMQS